jgi:HEAT repeat protein
VLVALRPYDFATLFRIINAQEGQTRNTIGFHYDDGSCLTYVLNFGALSDAASALPHTHALWETGVIWLDAVVGPLALGQTTDDFIRIVGLTEAQRQALTVCVPQTVLDADVEHVLTTRFGIVKYGVAATDCLFAGNQTKVAALGEIGQNFTEPALLHALSHSPWIPQEFRIYVSESGETYDKVREIRNKSAVPALLAALNRSNPGTRVAVDEALGKIGDDAAIPRLIAALKNSNKDVRRRVAETLGKIGNVSAAPALIEALKDSDWKVCETAAEALGKIGDVSAPPALIEALKDSDWKVRKTAAEALGEIGDVSAAPALIEALKDSDWKVRETAVGALGKIGDASAAPALIDALKDSEYRVRFRAAHALIRLGSSVVPTLIAALEDNDDTVRSQVSEILAKIAALEDNDDTVRSQVSEVLAKIKAK